MLARRNFGYPPRRITAPPLNAFERACGIAVVLILTAMAVYLLWTA